MRRIRRWARDWAELAHYIRHHFLTDLKKALEVERRIAETKAMCPMEDDCEGWRPFTCRNFSNELCLQRVEVEVEIWREEHP